MPFAARAAIEELRASVRFGVHVIGFRATTLHVIDADPDHPVRAERELVRHPHASAAGKLLLAHDTEALATLPARLPRLTPATVTHPAALHAQLEAVRRDGLATQTDELETGLSCAALPIADETEVVRGALCLAGPSARAEAILAHLDAAARCAKILGPLLY
ncbi:IclR family transcriptional regulator domain-containing protein [Nocardia farcinica]|uniref:IclR family transcriptional regulator domain-containing protein n=1 Tax=Nocardia farcinica TaxID=37329 RepID=UPI002458DFA0|nr:IclR family transcriptional regulator C-terminal domain-containing protein [Nocardia farcinica]